MITVGCGIRSDTGCTKLCSSVVMRPPDVAAILSNSLLIQSRAAPMPRFGSVCVDSVCRVPNASSVLSYPSSRLALTSRSIARTSAGGFHHFGGPP